MGFTCAKAFVREAVPHNRIQNVVWVNVRLGYLDWVLDHWGNLATLTMDDISKILFDLTTFKWEGLKIED